MELDRASAAAPEQADCAVSQYKAEGGENPSLSSSLSLPLGHSALVRWSITLANSTRCHNPSLPHGENWKCTAMEEGEQEERPVEARDEKITA